MLLNICWFSQATNFTKPSPTIVLVSSSNLCPRKFQFAYRVSRKNLLPAHLPRTAHYGHRWQRIQTCSEDHCLRGWKPKGRCYLHVFVVAGLSCLSVPWKHLYAARMRNQPFSQLIHHFLAHKYHPTDEDRWNRHHRGNKSAVARGQSLCHVYHQLRSS